jgi:hypothetical protein
MMMLIYLSHDELNRALVQFWAALERVEVDCPTRPDLTSAGPGAAILIDLDHAPVEWVEAALGRPGGDGAAQPVAFHGYGASGDQLRGRGLAVHTRLRSRVLAELAAAATAADRAVARDTSDELTWVDLA